MRRWRRRGESTIAPSACAFPGNGYATESPLTLPRDWLEAIRAAESSSFLQETLGAGFMKGYVAIKHQEWDKFNATIAPTDYDWYLETV
jgi:glutamine synthetase